MKKTYRKTVEPWVEKTTAKWMGRLKLDRWDIRIKQTEQPGDGDNWGYVEAQSAYYQARIEFSNDINEHESSIVHELLHVKLNELCDTVYAAIAMLPEKRQRKRMHKLFVIHMEQFVVNMTDVLMAWPEDKPKKKN